MNVLLVVGTEASATASTFVTTYTLSMSCNR